MSLAFLLRCSRFNSIPVCYCYLVEFTRKDLIITKYYWDVLVSYLALSAIFLTASPNPASGFLKVATITSSTSGAMLRCCRSVAIKTLPLLFVFLFAFGGGRFTLFHLSLQIFFSRGQYFWAGFDLSIKLI